MSEEFDHGEPQRSEWQALSSISALWIHGTEVPDAQVRRAIRNVLVSQRRRGTGFSGEPRHQLLLALIQIAESIRIASERTLMEIVAEANSGGVSWAKISAALGASGSTAHYRYGGGLSESHTARLEHETALSIVEAAWAGSLPDEFTNVAKIDWEDMAPVVAVQQSWQALAVVLITVSRSILGDLSGQHRDSAKPWTDLLARAAVDLHNACQVLLTPEARSVLVKYAALAGVDDDWDSDSPLFHSSYGISRAWMADVHFQLFRAKLPELAEDEDSDAGKLELYSMVANLRDCVETLWRPECLRMRSLMEYDIVKMGEIPFTPSEVTPENLKLAFGAPSALPELETPPKERRAKRRPSTATSG